MGEVGGRQRVIDDQRYAGFFGDGGNRFEIGDDAIATGRVETVPSEVEDACREAIDECPSEAITITETERTEVPQTSSDG